MKLTTDQIIARHGLLVQAGAAPQYGWIVGAEDTPLRYYRTYDRNQAVALHCEKYGLKTEDTTVEDLARKHGITLSVDMFGIWTATAPSGFHSFRCDTVKEAVEMAAAQAERDIEYKAQKEASRARAEANAAGYVSGGYPIGQGFYPNPAPQPPAKKPAQVIAEAKAEAEKRIAEDVREHINSFGRQTGAFITGVQVSADILAAHAPGHEAKPIDTRVGVTLTTT